MHMILATCGDGQEPDPNDATACRPCERGNYKLTTTDWWASCTPCESGKSTLTTGSTTLESCIGKLCGI